MKGGGTAGHELLKVGGLAGCAGSLHGGRYAEPVSPPFPLDPFDEGEGVSLPLTRGAREKGGQAIVQRVRRR